MFIWWGISRAEVVSVSEYKKRLQAQKLGRYMDRMEKLRTASAPKRVENMSWLQRELARWSWR